MLTFPMLPGVEISVILLLFVALSIGTISGFVGVGGGFIMTPALIIMGFPAQVAVGTVVLWVMGNAIVGTLRHHQFGNVDIKLGLIMVISMLGGTETGIRALDAASEAGLADTAVLLVSICALGIIGGSTLFESIRTKSKHDKIRKGELAPAEKEGKNPLLQFISGIKTPPILYFHKADVRVSLWLLIIVGFMAGFLAGFIGIGGGVLTIPSMVYIFGVPSFVAVGTNMFQIIFSSAFNAARHTMEGNVIFFASFIMILGSSCGVYFGAHLTKHLKELTMRYVLGTTIMVSILGSVIKLIGTIIGDESAFMNTAMLIITFGGLAVIFCIVTGLFITAVRHSKGKSVPSWTHSLIND